MNQAQRRTVRGLSILAAGGAILLLGALFIEVMAINAGGHATISEAFWRLWASQPWVVLVSSHLVVAPACFLAGHFFAQSAVVYAALRAGVDLEAALLLALEARASYRLAKETGNGREPLTVMVAPSYVHALDAGSEE